MSVDILLETAGTRIVVEYDGERWHRGKVKTDRRKSERLRNAGYGVIRIRERPLPPITEHDVFCEPDTLIRHVAADVMESIGRLTGTPLLALAGYRELDAPVAEEAASADIEHRRKARARKNAR